MKKYLKILIFIIILLCGCSSNNSKITIHENSDIVICTDDNPVSYYKIDENKMFDIYDVISDITSGEQKGYLKDIYKITNVNQVKRFEVEGDIYYYNIFEYSDNKWVLIYDNEYWVCGCIYFNEVLDLQKLNQAKTFRDVENIDSTLINNGCGLNQLSANILVNRRQYQLNYLNTDTLNATLHYTKEGFYLIQYDQPLYSIDSSEIQVVSMEKIEDVVYNTVYTLL